MLKRNIPPIQNNSTLPAEAMTAAMASVRIANLTRKIGLYTKAFWGTCTIGATIVSGAVVEEFIQWPASAFQKPPNVMMEAVGLLAISAAVLTGTFASYANDVIIEAKTKLNCEKSIEATLRTE